jgi:hypothetical protein
VDLGIRARANTQHASAWRQAAEDGRDQQMDAIPKRCKPGPLLIICSCLLVEGCLKLSAIHWLLLFGRRLRLQSRLRTSAAPTG